MTKSARIDPSSSTTPGVDDEEKGRNQQASANGEVTMDDSDDDSDRQNLKGDGGNPKWSLKAKAKSEFSVLVQ
jgi:hypothetical protein